MSSPKMTVSKSNDKAQKKAFRKNVFGDIEGKTLQEPLNDKPEYKNVDANEVSVPAPEDGSIPTWRCANGSVMPMVKSVNKETGSVEYKPRKKKGPSKGKKYAPRAGKITKMLQGGAALPQKDGENIEEQLTTLNEQTAAHMPAVPSAISTDVFGSITNVSSAIDAVDFQALVHSWQMRSIGALNDAEFQLIKKSIFEKRQTAQAALVTAVPAEEGLQRTQSSDMTF